MLGQELNKKEIELFSESTFEINSVIPNDITFKPIKAKSKREYREITFKENLVFSKDYLFGEFAFIKCSFDKEIIIKDAVKIKYYSW